MDLPVKQLKEAHQEQAGSLRKVWARDIPGAVRPMQAWQDWAQRAGSAVVDLGSPLAGGGVDLTLVLQGLVSGLLFGGVYSLMAVGLTLIFGVMRVVNFAHGDMMVWGMYLAYVLAARAGDSRHARVANIGRSTQGRDIPVVYLTAEGHGDPAAIGRFGRPVIWLIGQQHGNEPAGGEVARWCRRPANGFARNLDRSSQDNGPANPGAAERGHSNDQQARKHVQRLARQARADERASSSRHCRR